MAKSKGQKKGKVQEYGKATQAFLDLAEEYARDLFGDKMADSILGPRKPTVKKRVRW